MYCQIVAWSSLCLKCFERKVSGRKPSELQWAVEKGLSIILLKLPKLTVTSVLGPMTSWPIATLPTNLNSINNDLHQTGPIIQPINQLVDLITNDCHNSNERRHSLAIHVFANNRQASSYISVFGLTLTRTLTLIQLRSLAATNHTVLPNSEFKAITSLLNEKPLKNSTHFRNFKHS